jgi:cytochrome c
MALVRRAGLGALCAAFAAALAACESRQPGVPTAVPPTAGAAAGGAVGFDVGPVKTAAEYLAEPQFAAANVERGELLSLACAACHTFRAEQGALVGPNLHGVFGRPAAAVAGFAYSPALSATNLVWTPKALEAWLAEPAGFVVGTTMGFSGYRSPEDRRDLIAYLLQATQ